jgi:hypothetical protein
MGSSVSPVLSSVVFKLCDLLSVSLPLILQNCISQKKDKSDCLFIYFFNFSFIIHMCIQGVTVFNLSDKVKILELLKGSIVGKNESSTYSTVLNLCILSTFLSSGLLGTVYS